METVFYRSSMYPVPRRVYIAIIQNHVEEFSLATEMLLHVIQTHLHTYTIN